jgi:hypothetical protein
VEDEEEEAMAMLLVEERGANASKEDKEVAADKNRQTDVENLMVELECSISSSVMDYGNEMTLATVQAVSLSSAGWWLLK